MSTEVCIALVCLWCGKAILPGEWFHCEIEEDWDEGQCWHGTDECDGGNT